MSVCWLRLSFVFDVDLGYEFPRGPSEFDRHLKSRRSNKASGIVHKATSSRLKFDVFYLSLVSYGE